MTVVWEKNAEKELEKMTKKVREQIKKGLLKISKLENPRLIGKAMKGSFANFWRYRIGDYRIICDIQDTELVILVVKIGHRKDVYKKL